MGKKDLVEVFKDTHRKYLTDYVEDTHELITSGTYVYDEPISDFHIMPHRKMPNKDMIVGVVSGGTVEIGHTLIHPDKRTAILNFADALKPGGLLLVGATTQEENICRCSNLYASLTSEDAKKYYNDNRAYKSFVYTDDVIYSRDVAFFKDDKEYEDVDKYYMDVITCPAPSVHLDDSIEESVIYNRVEKIIKVAALNKVDNLVLGAWGCGAFSQNPEVVSKAFAEAVKKYPAFDCVIYAVRVTTENPMDDANYRAFWNNCNKEV